VVGIKNHKPKMFVGLSNIGVNTMSRKIEKISNYKNYDEWVADVLRQEKNGADDYVKLAFDEYSKNEEDEKALLVSLRQAAKVNMGFKNLAQKTGLSRESLYRALSPKGNPRFHTIHLILDALGYKLQVRSQYNHKHLHSTT
jgi:probable addiction module antidote protein